MTECNNRSRRGWKVMRIIGMTVAGLVFAVIFALVFGYVVQYLWNWLMPSLFGLKTITFLQAFVLIILCKVLFSGFGHHMGRSGHGRGHGNNNGHFHHGFHGSCSGGDKRYFRQFWEEEGKAAFGEYIKRMDNSGCCTTPDSGKTDKSS